MVSSELNNYINIINIAINARLKSIDIHMSNIVFKLTELLYELGIFTKFQYMRDKKILRLFFKYKGDGVSVIKNIKNLKRPSRKNPYTLQQLQSVKETVFNQHILILSTKKGIILDKDCFFYSVGGVPLLSIEFF